MSQPRDPNAEAANPRWQAADPRTLDWAVWDDDCVLFHQLSGKTHLVNSATRRLLADLLCAPLDLEQITAALGADWPVDERQALGDETSDLLWRLEELGLVVAS